MSKQTKQHEQQQADDFERRLNVLLKGGTNPLTDETSRLGQQLVQIAQQTAPRPAFERQLRAQLLQKAAQKAQEEASRPPWWAFWQRSPTMKRNALSLAGLAALAIIVIAGWSLFKDRASQPDETVAVLPEMTATPESIAAVVATATQEQLPTEASVPTEAPVVVEPTSEPVIITEEAAQALPPSGRPLYGGMGGGGGGGDGSFYGGPFVDATLTLNTTLPEVASAPVYESTQMYGQPINLDALRAFAEKMGVSGDLYFDWYAGMPIEGYSSGEGPSPNVYRLFDGNRRVTAYDSGEFIFEDLQYSMGFNARPLAFAENAAIAEQFARDRGLLDFPYVLHQSWGYEVQFLELVDGRPVNVPRLLISIAPGGQVATVVLRSSVIGASLGEQGLRSAQAAWDYLQAHLEDGQFYFNLYASNPDYYMPSGPGGQKTHWQREFTAGETVSLATWVSVYRLADGSGTPLLIANNNILVEAERGILEQMADTVAGGSSLRLTGVLSGEPGSQSLALASWEAITGPSDLYLGGTTRLRDGQIVLEVPGGYPFPLANAPADLPLDVAVNVYSSGIRADEAGLPILEWNSIDLWNTPMLMEVDYAAIDPYNGITGIIVDQVQLGHQQVYPGEMMPGSTVAYNPGGSLPNLVPVWIFTGQTNKGDTVEFIVPALSAIELQ